MLTIYQNSSDILFSNVNKVTSEVSIDVFICDPSFFSKYCSNSLYVDKTQGHVTNRDLRLTEHNKLCGLFFKGPKYKEPTSINLSDTKKSIPFGIDECIEFWSKTKGIKKLELAE